MLSKNKLQNTGHADLITALQGNAANTWDGRDVHQLADF